MKRKNKNLFLQMVKRVWYLAAQLFRFIFRLMFYIFRAFYIGLSFIAKKSNAVITKRKTELLLPKSEPKVNKLKEIKNIAGSLSDFNKLITGQKSTIGIILGARGTGKTALGLCILENIKSASKINVYAIGFKNTALPRWINTIDNVEDAKTDSFVLVDESGITFSSRNSMSLLNKLLSEMLLVARHNGLSLIFIAQNSSNIEINTIRQADYIMLKPSSLLQKDFERKKIKEIYEKVDEDFRKLAEVKGLTYAYSDVYSGFVANSLPGFWSEKVSKAFRK